MVRSDGINEGDIMLNQKKLQVTNEKTPKIACKTNVAKAITKSNKKHAKMLKMLAK